MKCVNLLLSLFFAASLFSESPPVNAGWELIEVKIMNLENAFGEFLSFSLRARDFSSTVIRNLSLLKTLRENETTVVSLKLEYGEEKVDFFAIAEKNNAIIVLDKFVDLAKAVFRADQVSGYNEEAFKPVFQRSRGVMNSDRIDKIQIWLEAINVLDSQKVFRLMVGNEVIASPFYALNDEQNVRLYSSCNFSESYSVLLTAEKLSSVRNRMSPVQHQGNRGTCNVFSAIALFEFNHPGKYFSEQCLAKFSSNQDAEFIAARIKYGRERGLYEKQDCPYDSSPGGRDNIPDLSRAYLFRSGEWFDIRNFRTPEAIDHIKQRIDSGYPVAITTLVAGQKWSLWQDKSVIEEPTEQEIEETCRKTLSLGKKLCAGHVVVVTGYDDATKSFEFKNSWGKGFKDFGYGRLSYGYYLRMGYDTMVAGERLYANRDL